MPFVLDPDEKIDLMLKADQVKPADRQMTFEFKYLSARNFRSLQRLLDQAFTAAEASRYDDEDKATETALMLGIESIRSGEKIKPCSVAEVVESLTVDERWELLIEWRKRLTPGADEKKASPSPSPLPTESCAQPAATESATPSQPSPNPCCSLNQPAPCVAETIVGISAPTAEAGEKTS